MDLLQLRYFQKVARTKSLSKAASEMYVSQSSVSQSLKTLENSVGVPLFEHAPGKPLQLNDSGATFLKMVDSALSIIDDAVEQARLQAEHRVFVAYSVASIWRPMAMEYLEKNPKAKLSLLLMRVVSVKELLQFGDVDFALTPCPMHKANLDCRELYTEESFAVVDEIHPLWGKRYIERDALMKSDIICNYSEADRFYLERIFEESNPTVNILLETSEEDLIKVYRKKYASISIMPARIAMRNVKAGLIDPNALLRIKDCKFNVPTCITKKVEGFKTKEAEDFYNFIIDFCENETEEVDSFIKEMWG